VFLRNAQPLVIVALLIGIVTGSMSLSAATMVSRATRQGRFALSYGVVHGWPVLPEGYALDIVTGVGVDSHGNVFVFHRAGRKWPSTGPLDTTPISRPPVVLFDGQTGAVLAQWGADRFAMPHGLAVDQRDNVWLTDVALHQVYQFTHNGQLLLTLGTRGVPGNDSAHFNKPTDVAIAADGSIYVSDGYKNSRIVQFAADGRFVRQWGRKGGQPGEFDLPHGIALDGAGRVFVADRANARVQVFDRRGRFLFQWKGAEYGRPFDVAIANGGRAFIADGGDIPDDEPDRSSVVVVDRDGRVLERFGRYGFYDGQFFRAHDIAVGLDDAVYVGDASGRVQKFVRTP
jgi:peptidylamidoglycolate lyase